MPDIAFWNKCNNKCVMCTNAADFAAQDAAQYGLKCQIEKLERYLKGMGKVYLKNSDKPGFLSLTGGEPSIHPDFFKLLAYYRERLPDAGITLLSNGRRFADKAFTRRFLALAAPPFTLAVPLHGAYAAAHDRIAGANGSFSQTMKGLGNLFSGLKGQTIELRLVLHRMNIKEFGGLLAFILKRFHGQGHYRVVAIHYEIEGMSRENHARLALKLSDSAKAVNAAAALISRFRDFRLYHLPLCVVKKELRPLCWITLPPEDRFYSAKCSRCAARKKCLGLMAEYYKEFSDGEINPL